MYEPPKKRSYLPISSISLLGSCETKFYDAMFKPRVVTTAMKAGTVAHEKVAAALPKITKEQIISEIRAGRPIQVRELPVYDEKTHICGRIDQLHVTGFSDKGKNTGIIIDDKYPTSTSYIHGLTLYYKLQLSAYAVALGNSEPYGSICKAVGAQLIYREKGTNSIIKQYDMDSDMLGACMSNTGAAVEDAWAVYKKSKEAEHRRFDAYSGEWTSCFCGKVPAAQMHLK